MAVSTPDVLLIDKSAGMTSFDIIRALRKKCTQKPPKMGHAGTLDPFATGLMLIGVGTGTKKLHMLTGLSKVYEATVLLGRTTDTLDIDGMVIDEKDAYGISHDVIMQAVGECIGKHTYLVPAYAAVKQNGERLYAKARRGEVVERPERVMEVYEASVLSIEGAQQTISVRIRFTVASGTYIRSLAEAIGKKLNIPAMLTVLRRTYIGEFSVENAKTLENIDDFEIDKGKIN